ncbi:MAG: hypothetical protein F6K11_29030 [Leptolyngbya sp. SIO3F4]|nr:hypothetical protein [Leptolyngbya sp. SIO3F4]
MTTFTNNNQPVSVEELFMDLTPEEAQNISGGGWVSSIKNITKRALSTVKKNAEGIVD